MADLPFPIRKECPPGACVCQRDDLLDKPDADLTILRLTKEEEKRLCERIEAIETYEELLRVSAKLQQQLGIVLTIEPGDNEVRTVMGLTIELAEKKGLCRKTREAIPAAIRRCMKRKPEIIYALLNSRDLFGL
ncbi:hypothetical protein [Pseudoduganella ginsengisoli]|uniref:Ribosomal protein S3AE n=1 Tax=Pseudoduganella ginsengisoli TaxID=1462440 RepID=A0A6L6PYV6_9BURK|nr:hypothetical protein [Pseudoduganella ginsengisoli]MTW02359.1 hypothetical protein [Pseudoduganella ginsengisoli]